MLIREVLLRFGMEVLTTLLLDSVAARVLCKYEGVGHARLIIKGPVVATVGEAECHCGRCQQWIVSAAVLSLVTRDPRTRHVLYEARSARCPPIGRPR